MTNSAKDKGDRAEREIAGILADQLGIRVRRKLGAGRADDTGDLDGLDDCVAQVKDYRDILRAIREAVDDSPIQQANAGATHGVSFIRRPGGRWIAVLTLEQWATMYREATA